MRQVLEWGAEVLEGEDFEYNQDFSPTSVLNTALLALYFSVLPSKAEDDREQTAESNERNEEPQGNPIGYEQGSYEPNRPSKKPPAL